MRHSIFPSSIAPPQRVLNALQHVVPRRVSNRKEVVQLLTYPVSAFRLDICRRFWPRVFSDIEVLTHDWTDRTLKRMLIGISGGLCAGKHSVQDFLIREHNFIPLTIAVLEHPSEPCILPRTNPAPTSPPPLTLPSATALLDHTTAHWRTRFVTTSITDSAIASILAQRPGFLLLHIDAPLLLRHTRHLSRDCAPTSSHPPTALDSFARASDSHLPSLLSLSTVHATLSLLNTYPSLPQLHAALHSLVLPSPTRLRPTWDHYFMRLANLAAHRSNCMRRAVGCVLVRDRRVVATGYNGTPRGVTNCGEGGCPRCNDAAASKGGAALSTCLCLHAEENALLEAGRERVSGGGGPGGGMGMGMAGAVLYCNTCPCLTCSVKIVQVGIGEVVYSQSYYMDEKAAALFREAGVRLRQFEAPVEGVVGWDGEQEVVQGMEGLGVEEGMNGEVKAEIMNGETP